MRTSYSHLEHLRRPPATDAGSPLLGHRQESKWMSHSMWFPTDRLLLLPGFVSLVCWRCCAKTLPHVEKHMKQLHVKEFGAKLICALVHSESRRQDLITWFPPHYCYSVITHILKLIRLDASYEFLLNSFGCMLCSIGYYFSLLSFPMNYIEFKILDLESVHLFYPPK